MSKEQGGVLENLPRSRPGTRSAKREGAAEPRGTRSGPAPAAAAGVDEPPERGPSSLGALVSAGGRVAETGLRVVSRGAGALFGRLPRP
jgi:hypothetical protein